MYQYTTVRFQQLPMQTQSHSCIHITHTEITVQRPQ